MLKERDALVGALIKIDYSTYLLDYNSYYKKQLGEIVEIFSKKFYGELMVKVWWPELNMFNTCFARHLNLYNQKNM